MAIFAQEATAQWRMIGTAVVVVLALVVFWLVTAAGRRYVRRMQDRSPEAAARARTLWVVMRRVAVLVIVMVAVLFLFQIWGWSMAPFVAVGTVLAAALGFGAQDLVKDFLSGFFILMEDQFQIGDTVTIAGTTGEVVDIQLRITVLRDFEGNAHFVPNGQIEVASNFTSKYAQPVIDVSIAYETDVDRALEVFRDELAGLAEDPEFAPLISEAPEVLGVNELGDSAVVIRGRVTTVADARWAVRREALRRIKKRFDAEGIVIPFPQVTVNQKGRPEEEAPPA